MIQQFEIQGKKIKIETSDANVFNPHPITLLLANAIEIKPGDTVLEVGSGSGLISIVAAKLGAKQVVSTDIAEPARKMTRFNADLNGLDGQLKVVGGDLFKPVKNQKFDVIVSNPPCMPFPEGNIYLNEGMSLAVNGGEDGTIVMARLIKEANKYLEKNGCIYIPIAKWGNWKKIISQIYISFNSKTVLKGFVKYYLAEYDENFNRHINSLERLGIVKFSDKKELKAEILIQKIKPKI